MKALRPIGNDNLLSEPPLTCCQIISLLKSRFEVSVNTLAMTATIGACDNGPSSERKDNKERVDCRVNHFVEKEAAAAFFS